jgi:hypothetical protein
MMCGVPAPRLLPTPDPTVDRATLQGRLERFRQRWEARDGLEKQQAQEFLRELLWCYGRNTQAHDVLFEYPLSVDGRQRWADLLLPEELLVEMKSAHETDRLADHYPQAEGYWRASGAGETRSPRFVVLCSFRRLLVYQPGEHPGVVRADLRLGDLVERPEILDILRDREPDLSGGKIDLAREAVDAVAQVHHRLLDRKVSADDARDLVLQVTWCMFAQDLGLLPERLFHELLGRMRRDPTILDLDPLGQLFAFLGQEHGDRPGIFQPVPYANGGLFARPARVVLEPAEVELLRIADDADWTLVEPAVFGGLLQSSIDRERRHQIGAHYTPKRKIDRIIQPTIVTPWRLRIDALDDPDDAAQLIAELSRFRVLDPACGCGNFLYVAYDALRGLEADARQRLAELCRASGRPLPEGLPRVPLGNMLGIDTDGFAVHLARVVLWIGHALAVERHQLLGETGPMPVSDAERAMRAQDAPLPLPNITSIVEADALQGDWPACDAIVGNPPFIGSQHLRDHLGDATVKRLDEQFGVGVREYVTYWFRKAQDHLQPGQRAGFVATNSIREGRAREVSLDYLQATGGIITEATSSIPWDGEANVHVSLANWVKQPAAAPGRFLLDDLEVVGITSSLTRGSPLPPPPRLSGNAGRSFQGVIPVGDGFELTTQQAHALLLRPEAPYAQVVRPFLKGKDLTDAPDQGPRRWIIDFADRTLEEAMGYPAALAMVRDRVKPIRDRNRDRGFREQWWKHGRSRGELRTAIAGLARFITANEYGKRIVFAWQGPEVCPNNKTVAIASADDAVLGVLLSRPFAAWIVRWGGRLKADLHFTPTSVFETFPFPDLDGEAGAAITAACVALVERRSALCLADPERPVGLTTLYNRLDDGAHRDLAKLHDALDQAVLRAYGWPLRLAGRTDEAEDELLVRLHEANRTIADGGRPGYEGFPLAAPPAPERTELLF